MASWDTLFCHNLGKILKTIVFVGGHLREGKKNTTRKTQDLTISFDQIFREKILLTDRAECFATPTRSLYTYEYRYRRPLKDTLLVAGERLI